MQIMDQRKSEAVEHHQVGEVYVCGGDFFLFCRYGCKYVFVNLENGTIDPDYTYNNLVDADNENKNDVLVSAVLVID